MNFEIKFDTDKNKDYLVSETKDYFVDHGFNVARFEKDFVEFERGSVLFNKFKFHPLKWKSNTKVSFQEEGKVKAHISIDLTNQVVTLKEQMYWENFIENYQTKLTSMDTGINMGENLLAQEKKKKFLHLSKILGMILIIATLILLLAVYFNY